ncbi:hypothetical protein [Ornithinimicrobium murale]|uniref:hypothetical protein n=1 Tax=Ornithinimicrobium murale TaxID=1050153 RepID=UPI000E0D00FB|nr:hypothetical protein [Ornithinimicrobium murale]
MDTEPTPVLVGLSGRAGSDKDTAASLLVSRHDFTAYAFSTPLQDSLLKMDPFVDNRVRLRSVVDEMGWKSATAHQRYGSTIRRYMVALGAALRSQFGPDLLVRRLHEQLLDDYGPELTGARVVVRDVRLADEARFITSLGGRVISVVQPAVRPLPHDLRDELPDDLVHGSATAGGDPDRLDRQLSTLLDLPARARKDALL